MNTFTSLFLYGLKNSGSCGKGLSEPWVRNVS